MDIHEIVNDVVKSTDVPARFDDLDAQTRRHIRAEARARGITVDEAFSTLTRPADVEAQEDAAEIARQVRHG